MIKIMPDEELLGRKIPMWYGLAWRRFDTAQSVLILWPFNLPAAALRWFWFRLRFAAIKGAEKKYYDAGGKDGWRIGFEAGREVGRREEEEKEATVQREWKAKFVATFAYLFLQGPEDKPR